MNRQTLRRIASLVFAPFYLVMVARILFEVSRPTIPLGLSLSLVFVGSLIIMIVLSVMGERMLFTKPGESRFSLRSVFLLSVPVGIYFAYLRVIWVATIDEKRPEDPILGALVTLLAGGMMFIVVSSVILLCLADALMWVLLGIRRIFV